MDFNVTCPRWDGESNKGEMIMPGTMADKYVCSGYCCTDCLFYVAYGDVPTDISQADIDAWLTEVTSRNDGFSVVLGMPTDEHNDTCPRRNPCGLDECDCSEVECDCETISFSSRQCDVCGSNLGGERHAVSFFKM